MKLIMDEKSDFIEGEKIEEPVKKVQEETSKTTNSNYKPVTEFTVKSKKEKKSGFGKTVVTPFLCGVLDIPAPFRLLSRPYSILRFLRPRNASPNIVSANRGTPPAKYSMSDPSAF